jgi:hypothetical protein
VLVNTYALDIEILRDADDGRVFLRCMCGEWFALSVPHGAAHVGNTVLAALDHAIADHGRVEAWRTEDEWTIRYRVNGGALTIGEDISLVFESREEAEAHIAMWRRDSPEMTYTDVAYLKRQVTTGPWVAEPPTEPCDRTDLPEQSDMHCPCGFEAGEHKAWRRRYCRNRRYPEHGALSPCVLCGYLSPTSGTDHD